MGTDPDQATETVPNLVTFETLRQIRFVYAPAVARGASGGTRTDEIYERVRADILAGRLKPGQRLKFADLIATYGASAGAMREALNRVAGRGLVQGHPHQGFVVTPLSHRDLQELTAARILLEGSVLRAAVVDGDLKWESRIVAAHHELERTALHDAREPHGVSDDWARVHADFHNALLAGCINRRLLDMAMALREEAELYRRWSVSLADGPVRDVAAEHKALRDAAISRDPHLADRLLRQHLQRTAEQLVTCATDSHIRAG